MGADPLRALDEKLRFSVAALRFTIDQHTRGVGH